MEYTVVLHPAEEGGYWAEVPKAIDRSIEEGNVKRTVRNEVVDLTCSSGYP